MSQERDPEDLSAAHPAAQSLSAKAARALKLTWQAWLEHDAQRMGAALAYYSAFSLAPILMIAIAVAGMAFGQDAARDQMIRQLRELFGTTGAAAVEEMLDSTRESKTGVLATVVGVVTLLVGASSVFAELQSALNLIWSAPKPTRPVLSILRARFLSFAMVLVIGFMLLLSLLFTAALSAVRGDPGARDPITGLAQGINLGVSIVVTTFLFALIYKVMPDVRVEWRDVGEGAFFTAILFSLGKLLIGAYLGNSALASTYGAAGSFAVLLVWVYYSAQLILFGAEFTRVRARLRGS